MVISTEPISLVFLKIPSIIRKFDSYTKIRPALLPLSL